MIDVFKEWLYFGNSAALKELRGLTMQQRNQLAAEAKNFADWLATENSREINK